MDKKKTTAGVGSGDGEKKRLVVKRNSEGASWFTGTASGSAGATEPFPEAYWRPWAAVGRCDRHRGGRRLLALDSKTNVVHCW
jgi:hypothetical protein